MRRERKGGKGATEPEGGPTGGYQREIQPELEQMRRGGERSGWQEGEAGASRHGECARKLWPRAEQRDARGSRELRRAGKIPRAGSTTGEGARWLGMKIRAQGLREEGEGLGWTPAGEQAMAGVGTGHVRFRVKLEQDTTRTGNRSSGAMGDPT